MQSETEASVELMAVGQTSAALSLLHDVISNRRNRSAPLPVLEPIMLRLISLCVTLRRGKMAKDALYLYKNMTQNLTVATIEVRYSNAAFGAMLILGQISRPL